MAGISYTSLVVLNFLIGLSDEHGMLFDPVSRSTAWRKDFDTPPNYTDNQLNCGGFAHQWEQNGGKCGECGDPWDLDVATGQRPNQAGGTYATGTIVGEYTEGQVMTVTLQITAMHQGWYEFRLCPVNNADEPVTWECLDQTLLEFTDGTTRYNIGSEGVGVYDFQLRLPPGLTCSQCVLQWKWVCGNRWGEDQDGNDCLGCGPQEEFYGCADITIYPSSSTEATTQTATTTDATTTTTTTTEASTTTTSVDVTTSETESTTETTPTVTFPTETTPTETTTSGSESTTPPSDVDCTWVGAEGAGTDEWCNINCSNTPIFCPEDMCSCA